MTNIVHVTVVGLLLVVGLTGIAVAYSPSTDVVSQYDDHASTLADVEYATQIDVVFSLDENGDFYAYPVQQEQADKIWEFEAGHALTVNDDIVYIAAADTLWEFDATAGELTELTELEEHPPAIDYDETRDVIWTVGDGTVYGYNAEDGSEYMTYTEHTDGIEDIHVKGDYIATGTTWSDEVVVYDIEDESVAFAPTLPDDVGQVGAVHITDSGELVVGTGAEEGDVVAMFDIVDQESIVEYREHIFSVSAVEYDEQHDVIISMGFDNTIKFFDVEAGEVATVYEHEDTIYTGALDTRNDVLWFGDGEERIGTVTGIDVFSEEPTPTPTATPEPTPTPESTPTATPEPDPEAEETPTPDADPDETPTATGEEGPGFGAGLAVLTIIGLALLATRKQ